MQVQNIQRPSLYTDFFNLELMWNNEYLTYIQTTTDAVTPNLCKIANICIDTIKKSLKSKNKHSSLILVGKLIAKKHRELRISEECGFKNEELRNDLRNLNKLRRVTQSKIEISFL